MRFFTLVTLVASAAALRLQAKTGSKLETRQTDHCNGACTDDAAAAIELHNTHNHHDDDAPEGIHTITIGGDSFTTLVEI